jgi:hypothetical protein
MDWAMAFAVKLAKAIPKAAHRSLRASGEILKIERIKFLLAEIKKLVDCVVSEVRHRKNQGWASRPRSCPALGK